MQGFLSYKFKHDKSENLVSNLKGFLNAANILPIDGKALNPINDLNVQLIDLIEQCDFMIAIHFKEFPNDYSNQEIGFAKGKGIPVILITDDPNTDGNLLSHQYKLDLNDDGLLIASSLITGIDAVIPKVRMRETLLSKHTQDPRRKKILSELLQLDWINLEKSKRNYCYHILLNEHPSQTLKDRFYAATFKIHFEAILLESEVVIETARTDNNFHQIYDKLVKNRRSIYRYILKTEEKSLPSDFFSVNKVTVSKNELEIGILKSSKGDSNHWQLVCTHENLSSLVGSEVEFTIEINTIIDKRRNEFTVLFGYPVENLLTEFFYHKTDINRIDIVDMLTAKGSPVKVSHEKLGVGANYNGWIFPNSGITYVWSYPN